MSDDEVSLTNTLNVAVLSQPAAFDKPVLVLEPAAVKVNPSHVKGSALGQMLESLVLAVALHVTVIVISLLVAVTGVEQADVLVSTQETTLPLANAVVV